MSSGNLILSQYLYFQSSIPTEDEMHIVCSLDNVPTRPTAAIDLVFDNAKQKLICIVKEKGQETPILTYNDSSGYESLFVKGHESSPDKFHEAVCFQVLARSDVFCMRQAYSDFPKAVKSKFWKILLEEIKHAFLLGSVMYS